VTTAISLYFWVTVDGYDLGSFSECQGLGCEVSITQHEEGGVNDFVHQLPGRLKYTNVTLTRPVSPDSKKVSDWIASMVDRPTRTQAEIVALNPEGEPLFRWTLVGVVPAKWKGPSFSVDSAKLATESLELAHHGFLREAR
jgi:phage tail-like protein